MVLRLLSVAGGRKLTDEATSDESVGLRIYIEGP